MSCGGLAPTPQPGASPRTPGRLAFGFGRPSPFASRYVTSRCVGPATPRFASRWPCRASRRVSLPHFASALRPPALPRFAPLRIGSLRLAPPRFASSCVARPRHAPGPARPRLASPRFASSCVARPRHAPGPGPGPGPARPRQASPCVASSRPRLARPCVASSRPRLASPCVATCWRAPLCVALPRSFAPPRFALCRHVLARPALLLPRVALCRLALVDLCCLRWVPCWGGLWVFGAWVGFVGRVGSGGAADCLWGAPQSVWRALASRRGCRGCCCRRSRWFLAPEVWAGARAAAGGSACEGRICRLEHRVPACWW
ncbi:hypothetical protein C8D87_10748 [Lentzea atacamensis]|uniref:Uncharacterized protein n=1 Tax=Lentzea atacamensis TaxID=531938 RepID=A0ABX9E5J8_9PSEU|nr:hypothetical protein C8D87_10748 [Lentzea atacamensis]